MLVYIASFLFSKINTELDFQKKNLSSRLLFTPYNHKEVSPIFFVYPNLTTVIIRFVAIRQELSVFPTKWCITVSNSSQVWFSIFSYSKLESIFTSQCRWCCVLYFVQFAVVCWSITAFLITFDCLHCSFFHFIVLWIYTHSMVLTLCHLSNYDY